MSLLMRFDHISFQVGFGINLNNVGNPDSAFPSAVSKTLEGMQANFQNPFWMFQISAFPFQNSVIDAIKYLRLFAKNVIEERCLALQNRDETPSDILEHIVKGAQENPEINMDDLVDNFLTIFIAGMNIQNALFVFCLFVCFFLEQEICLFLRLLYFCSPHNPFIPQPLVTHNRQQNELRHLAQNWAFFTFY